jgi:hypothetical protein
MRFLAACQQVPREGWKFNPTKKTPEAVPAK